MVEKINQFKKNIDLLFGIGIIDRQHRSLIQEHMNKISDDELIRTINENNLLDYNNLKPLMLSIIAKQTGQNVDEVIFNNETIINNLIAIINDNNTSKKDIQFILGLIYELDQKALNVERLAANNYGLDSDETHLAHKNFVDLNKNHVILIEQIINKFGWLSEEEIGKIPNQTLWMIIQHSDIETQKKFYPRIVEETNKGNISKECLAKLTDRILVSQGKEQLYGTQYKINSDLSYSLYPISKIEELNKRRQTMGLSELETELEMFNKNNEHLKK